MTHVTHPPLVRDPLPTVVLLALLLAAAPALADGVPRFVEEGALTHVYAGDWEFFVGGGVAAFDCNDDGKPELFMAGGSRPASLLLNTGEIGGALAFSRLAAPAPRGVTGAYPLDIDADGVVDLAVLRLGENLLLRGLGDCRFEIANRGWGFDGGDAWTVSFGAVWEPAQSWPTLAFGNYVDRHSPEAPFGGCSPNLLVRPAAAGGFDAPLPLTPSYCALSLLFSDWDRSGRRDLRISNDRQYYLVDDDRSGGEQLWRLDPSGATPYGVEDGWERLQIWGMGVASADLTGDGFPEYFLTSMADNKLRTLQGGDAARGPRYRDIAFERGVTAHRPASGDDLRPSTAWHAQFDDLDNDGRLDLFIAKGNIDSMSDFALEDPNDLFLAAPDGTFRTAAAEAGLASGARSRGAALVDLNLDGLLDVVVVNRRQPAQAWRNLGSGEDTGRWLELRLRQPGGNRDAIGAWVEVRSAAGRIERELTVGGGHAGGQLGWLHVGLGEAEEALVRVRWPDGGLGPWLRLEADRFALIERGALEARAWTPGTPLP